MGFVNITILHAKLKYSVVVEQIQILFELQRKQKTKATHLEKKDWRLQFWCEEK